MKPIEEMLRDADPIRREPPMPGEARDRIRRAIVDAAAAAGAPRVVWFRPLTAVAATVTVIALAFAALWFQAWPPGGATLQAAAVRFEVRLAEDVAAAGLSEARVGGSDRVVYLHPDPVVTNADIAQSRVAGDEPSGFGVSVEFNAAGAEKMRLATAGHIGRPLAILIDGEVAMAPTLRSPITTSALLSGNFTRAEAERIVKGIEIEGRRLRAED